MHSASLASVHRLGILGGTFDPIHYGHLAIAEEVRTRLALDAILFIPTGEPPHKPAGRANAEQRFQMTLLATADHPAFFVSRMEIDRPGLSYTVETLHALHADYPKASLHLIIGADMALDFPAWREPETIMELATVIAVTRPGYALARLPRVGERCMEMLVAPGLAISSTDLRQRVYAGQNLRYLVPDAVIAYIAKEGLYRED